MIAPEGLIVNSNQKEYESLRKYLVENADVRSIISLPRGSFEPYNRAKANIIFMENCHYKRQAKNYWYFNVQNDGYTLDKKRARIDGPNDLEIILSERNLEKQTDDYLLKIGVSRIRMSAIKKNKYILAAGHYIEPQHILGKAKNTFKIGDLIELSGKDKVGDEQDTPVMSITMHDGLIDQKDKFKKRVASKDISKYRKVYRNELVVGFPIDEGVLGFQTKYECAAVSPAYKIWRLKREDVNVIVLEMILRSNVMREVYKSKMQGAVDRRRSIPNDVFLEIEIPKVTKKQGELVIAKYEESLKAKKELARKIGDLKKTVEKLFH